MENFSNLKLKSAAVIFSYSLLLLSMFCICYAMDQILLEVAGLACLIVEMVECSMLEWKIKQCQRFLWFFLLDFHWYRSRFSHLSSLFFSSLFHNQQQLSLLWETKDNIHPRSDSWMRLCEGEKNFTFYLNSEIFHYKYSTINQAIHRRKIYFVRKNIEENSKSQRLIFWCWFIRFWLDIDCICSNSSNKVDLNWGGIDIMNHDR